LKIPQAGAFAFFSFFGTVAAYQLHRFLRIHQYKDHLSTNIRLTWMLRNKWPLRILFLVSVLVSVIFSWRLIQTTEQLVLVGLSGVIVGFYALPISRFKGSMRQIPFLKIVLISLVWLLLVLLPGFGGSTPFPFWIAVVVFSTTAIQIIPFDIRDLSVDDPTMRTIPQIFGVFGSQLIATAGILSLTTVLVLESTFSWFLPLYLFSALFGYWIPISKKNLIFLEFLWEIPLLFLGLHLMVV
jgi:hypothetical protein